MSHASTSCTPTALTAHLAPKTRFCSATVARHGVYASTKMRNASAAAVGYPPDDEVDPFA